MTLHRGRSWLPEALTVATLMLLPWLFWWRLWALDPVDRAVIPRGDFTEQYYPLQLFAAREVAAGRVPAWDPFINTGQPGLADIQTGFYYPLNLVPNLVLALVGADFGIEVLTALVILHFSLASLFTYLLVCHLAQRSGARRPAARFAGAVSALTFTYSGYLTTFPVQQLTILETVVWLPLALFFLDRAFSHGHRARDIVLAGLALGMAFLAGHPQTAMYVAYATLAYGLFLAWSAHRARHRTPSQIQPSKLGWGLLAVLLALVLALGLAAVQLVPTLGFVARSTRMDLVYEEVAWGFPLVEMTHLLYPGYFGGSPQYLGILPMILGVAALFVVTARREVLFWLALGTIALVLALGGNTFLYSVAYLLTPGFGAVRNQERIIYLFAFAASILAGYGALTLVQPLPHSKRRGFCQFTRVLRWLSVAFLALTIPFYFGYLLGLQNNVEINMFEGLLRHHIFLLLILGGSALLFTLRLTGRVKRKWLALLALGLIWLNLFTINWRYNLAEPPANGPYPETGVVTFLKQQPGTFRISSSGLLPGGASAGIVYGLEDTTGNTPLRLEAFQQFENHVDIWRQWQLLNIEYLLSRKRLDGPGLDRVYGEGGIRVYQVGDPLPRAWVVYDTVVASDDKTIEVLNSEDFDPESTAVLLPADEDLDLDGGGRTGTAALVLLSAPGELNLEVSSNATGLLVVSQPFDPGWRASIDGEPTPVHRVNYLLQGVPIPAGTHHVDLWYPVSKYPAVLSLITLAVCLAVIVLSRRRARVA